MAAELEPGTEIPGEAGYTRWIAGPQARERELAGAVAPSACRRLRVRAPASCPGMTPLCSPVDHAADRGSKLQLPPRWNGGEPTCRAFATIWPIPFRLSTAPRPVEWVIAEGLTGYEEAVAFMEARADAIAKGEPPELVWLVEHPPLYTAGTSAQDCRPRRARPISRVHRSGRGGQYTYHGPGQRVAYVMLDLSRRQQDLRRYVAALEAWLIATLGAIQHPRRAPRRPGRRLGASARQGARAPRTRSPPSASACAAGSASTASA